MRYIVKAVPSRQQHVEYLQKHIPGLEVCWDQNKCAVDTMLRSFEMGGTDACVYLEDDIVLTKNFTSKLEQVVAEKPRAVIQFFSMRKADLIVGSRWDNNFLMLQCVYFPSGLSQEILDYAPEWKRQTLSVHPQGTDIMVRDFLRHRHRKYYIHIPSLVDHREVVSAIDRRRSSKRQSFTFVDPQED
jgi:hypothetical protein